MRIISSPYPFGYSTEYNSSLQDHGGTSLNESFIWTIIDIFIPTITMYHGTNLNAAISIVGSSKRNISLWNNWLAGTFKASDSANGWGGLGVYFSPSRRIVKQPKYRVPLAEG